MVSAKNIVAAALITQLAVLFIVILGAIFRPTIDDNDRIWDRTRRFSKNGPIFTCVALASIPSLFSIVFTDAFSVLWVPMVRDIQFRGFPWENTILAVWIFDIILLGVLIYYTGGSRTSPFTSLFFVFPTIALFLHEAGWRLFLYSILVVFLFTFNIIIPREEDPPSIMSFWLVTVVSFALTTGMGYSTRP